MAVLSGNAIIMNASYVTAMIRIYIADNPRKWAEDEENPSFQDDLNLD